MITTATTKSIRKQSGPYVRMSRMDYEIMRNVLALLPAAGITDEELSFLLGTRNQYFFDLLNPNTKQKLKPRHLDMLPQILQTKFSQIFPNGVEPKEMINLYHTAKKTDAASGLTSYSHVIYPDGEVAGIKIIWEKYDDGGVRRKINEALHESALSLIGRGYFKIPQRALPLFRQLKDTVSYPFSVADLQKSLAVLTREDKKKGKYGPLLKTDDEAMYRYVER